jgi:hypothetical protein
VDASHLTLARFTMSMITMARGAQARRTCSHKKDPG